jgi:hypothetical protein
VAHTGATSVSSQRSIFNFSSTFGIMMMGGWQ